MEYLGHTESSVYTFKPGIANPDSGFLPSVHSQACASKRYMTAGPPPDSALHQRCGSSTNCDTTAPNRGGMTLAHRCQLHGGGRKLVTGEWTEWSRTELSAADRARSGSELVRANVVTACQGLCERTRRTQADATRRLDDRANDIKFWRDEIRAEADLAGAEAADLDLAIGLLDRAWAEAEVPLKIAEECLHLREQRICVDLVHDNVEIELIKEVEIFRRCRAEMQTLLADARNQALLMQQSQAELTKDAEAKQAAFGMDRSAHKLRNTSRGLEFQNGIEDFDNTVSNQETWTQYSSDLITRSQGERAKARQYRDLIDQILCRTATEMTNQWNIVNAAFGERIREYIKARTDLETHLAKVEHVLS